jgi:hypothetical protein
MPIRSVSLEHCRSKRDERTTVSRRVRKSVFVLCLFSLSAGTINAGQDVPSSKDPAGMKRYEGSELIGYRAPKFDEYLLPFGPPTGSDPPAFEKSKSIEGQVSYYTYLALAGRSPAEVFRNYQPEFQRLGIKIQYEKGATQQGWFGPTFDKIAKENDLSQILDMTKRTNGSWWGRVRMPARATTWFS